MFFLVRVIGPDGVVEIVQVEANDADTARKIAELRRPGSRVQVQGGGNPTPFSDPSTGAMVPTLSGDQPAAVTPPVTATPVVGAGTTDAANAAATPTVGTPIPVTKAVAADTTIPVGPFAGRSVAEQGEPRAAFSNFLTQFGFEPGGPQTLARQVAGRQYDPFEAAFSLQDALNSGEPGNFNAEFAQFFGGQQGLDPRSALREQIQALATLAQGREPRAQFEGAGGLTEKTVFPTNTAEAAPFLRAVRELAIRRVSPLFRQRLINTFPKEAEFFGDLLARQEAARAAGTAVPQFAQSGLRAYGVNPSDFGF